MAVILLALGVLSSTNAGAQNSFGPAPGEIGLDSIAGSFEGSAISANQRAVGAYLDRLDQAGVVGELRELLDGLQGLSDGAYREALDRLHPEAYDAQAEVLLDLADHFTRQILDRPRPCHLFRQDFRQDSKRAGRGRCHDPRQDPWISAYGAFLNRRGSHGQIDFKSSGGGLAGGFDRSFLGGRLLASASLGAGRAISRVDGIGKGRITTVDLAAYAGTHFGPLEIEGVVGYGHGWHEGYRRVAWSGFSRGTRGRFQSDRVASRLRAGWRFAWSRWQLLPRTSIDYTYLKAQEFDEVGPSPVALTVRRRGDSIVTIRAGVEAAGQLEKTAYWGDLLEVLDGLWKPRLRLAWRQQVAGRDRALTAMLISAPPSIGRFRVEGRSANQGVEIGSGIDFVPRRANRLTLGVHYDAFLWSGISSHSVSARIRLGF